MLPVACSQFVRSKTQPSRCVRCDWELAAHRGGVAPAATRRTTKIWGDTVRAETCKALRCGRVIYFAQNVKTEKWTPFDHRPVAINVQPEIETSREIWTIDLAQAVAHFATCPASKEFRRRA